MTDQSPIYSLDEARGLLSVGSYYGDVYPFVAEADRDELARYFCSLGYYERQLQVRASMNGHKEPVPTESCTSMFCPRCGALMVVARACVTCKVCQHSEGCAG